jgi:hypothetical protein
VTISEADRLALREAMRQPMQWMIDPATYQMVDAVAPTTEPPLPRATVTPRVMISQAVKEVTAEARNCYVLNARASLLYSDYSNGEVKHRIAVQDINERIASVVKDMTTITPEHTPGGYELVGSVVVMKTDDLRKIIEAVGKRVLDKAIENGFIR